ncbi:MAG TPA: C-GCAxxG-C-C family (seleno)protein [Negativicutes bacterium]|nr:C-GCAxxG-C-C family (seleno)protein [Negativicutes bacterium]
MQGKIEQIAQQRMGAGYNCCQAVLLAADECFALALPPEVLTAGKLFGGGLKSGCICGALTGLVMAAGVLQEKHPHPLADGLAAHLYKRFQAEFGATCCRELRRGMSLWNRMGNRSCRALTGAAARILCELWAGDNTAVGR